MLFLIEAGQKKPRGALESDLTCLSAGTAVENIVGTPSRSRVAGPEREVSTRWRAPFYENCELVNGVHERNPITLYIQRAVDSPRLPMPPMRM